ncbi:MAG: mechanosensitive ion channel domain-containing protein [Pseudomonadota bacterium]
MKNKLMRDWRAITLLLLALMPALPSVAEDPAVPPSESASMRELIEQEEKAEKLIEEKSSSKGAEALIGRTPLEAMLGLQEAVRNQDYDKATSYLDLRYIPEDLQEIEPGLLLRAMSLVFGQQNILDLTELSDEPEGHLDDGLPSYRDLLGTVYTSGEEIPIYLQRIPDGKGGRVWRLSNATVARIPEMWDELGYSDLAIKLGDMLPQFSYFGMQNWQLVASAVFLIIAWPISMLITNILLRIALLIPNDFSAGLTRFFRGSLRFFIYLAIARGLMGELGLSLTARIILDSSGLDFIAWTVLLMGTLSLVRDARMRKMERTGKAQYAALLKPLTTIIKVFVVTVIALFWADRAGYDMTTIIAGLGVGSLAVALAAQKTLENVIGAATLYAARPVNPGDFCRFGKTLGIVEEIGLRSTLIRTLDRTLVVIPNSVFSSIEVENFSVRDRVRFFRQTHLQMADAEQLRLILAKTRELFYSHPKVLQHTVSVRLERIEQATVIMRLDAGINTRDYQEYLAIAEDINLRFIELVHDAGAAFSGAGQVLSVREFRQASAEEMARVEREMQEMREEERLPFPNYTDDEIAALKGSIDYPPKGSSA